MARERILVVDDEEDILELVKYNLAKNGYDVTCVTSGEEGLTTAINSMPDLIVLDLMLPGLDGLEICKILKNNTRTKDISVLMLSAKGEESDVVTGLDMGADDYILKPFSPKILLARIKAVLRRKQTEPLESGDLIHIHNIEINPGRHEVKVDGNPVQLTYTEFYVLHFLAGRPGWVFTRNQIIEAVRGGDYPVTDRSVDVQIVGLRKKLGAVGDYIETVRGVGYRMREN